MGSKSTPSRLIRSAKKAGLIVESAGSGHLRISDGKGKVVFCAFTPSDRRAALNLRATLRRTWPDLADKLEVDR